MFDNVLTNLLFAKATIYLGPTIATVGLSLQWPIVIFIDVLFYRPGWTNDTVSSCLMSIGAILILLGFLSINLSE